MTPMQADRPENARAVRTALMHYYRKKDNSHRNGKKAKYKVGQWVRIERPRNLFQRRELYPTNSTEIFRISRVITHHRRVMYCVETLRGGEVGTKFYQEQLVPVNLSKYKIKTVHRNRRRAGRNGQPEVMVSWEGLPSPEYDTYVPVNKIQDYVKARKLGLADISKVGNPMR